MVESAVAEEKDHADKIYKKLIYMIEEHHVSMCYSFFITFAFCYHDSMGPKYLLSFASYV